MKQENDRVRRAMNLALGTMYTLDEAGCQVLGVRVMGPTALVSVDQRPSCIGPTAFVMRLHRGAGAVPVCVANLHGCNVEWPARTEQAAPLALEGAA